MIIPIHESGRTRVPVREWDKYTSLPALSLLLYARIALQVPCSKTKDEELMV